MNTVPYFMLGMPIAFHGICMIHPLPIEKRLALGEGFLQYVFLPYMISEDVAHEKTGNSDVFALILSDEALLASFAESLRIVCRAEKIQLIDGKGIIIDEGKTALDSATFQEFAKIVRDWNCVPIHKPETEPKFATEEGRKQWLNLKRQREKHAKAEDDLLGTMISIVQFGGGSYVEESVILGWSKWKLANAYYAIINSREYEHSFAAVMQGGKKGLLKRHWTERIKPQQEIV